MNFSGTHALAKTVMTVARTSQRDLNARVQPTARYSIQRHSQKSCKRQMNLNFLSWVTSTPNLIQNRYGQRQRLLSTKETLKLKGNIKKLKMTKSILKWHPEKFFILKKARLSRTSR